VLPHHVRLPKNQPNNGEWRVQNKYSELC
jgi:hypothetical protein